jgi:molecular chaperone HscC
VFEGGRPRLIRNASGAALTPSAVGVLEDGQVVVGAAARDLAVTQPERVARGFKRLMGTDAEVEVAGQRFSAAQLSALVLKALKADAEADLSRPITEAVITVPAYFNDHQRQATKLAGELAGLVVRRIVNEPTAAALAYGIADPGADKRVLVFDLGGGTFDVTVMTVFEGTLEIQATAGDGHLGGEDFTDRLVASVLRERGLQLEAAEALEPLRVARLRAECERAKRELTSAEEATVRVPDAQGNLGDDRVALTRTTLAARARDLLERLGRPLDRALRDGGATPAQVDEVLLVGGATRMKLVVDFVRERLGKEPRCTIDPDEVVALGAAVQAGLIADDKALEDVVLTDVCPFTLGVEVVKRFGDRLHDGYFLPVIHRNTTIPVSREEVVSTVRPNQSTVNVRIYQGEARKVEGNLLLGELQVNGIPPGPEGQPVLLRFTYDQNGLLEVEAVVPGSGQRFQTVITNNVKGLSDAGVKKALAALQALKFYPRDDVDNQALLRFGERVVGEVPAFERDALEGTLDAFETAMSEGDRERFQAAREALLVTLSALGHPFPGASGEGARG